MLSFSSTTVQSSLRVNKSSPFARVTAGRNPSEILPRLYLANLFTAQNAEQLKALGVTHVVSIIENPPSFPESLPLQKLHIPIQDSVDADILQHLDTTTSFIRDALAADEKNVVLVHCLMGMSRSATVVCAYLIATAPMSASDAIALTTYKRNVVCPNKAFKRQLETYAIRFRTKKSRPERNMSRIVMERVRFWAGGVRTSQNKTTEHPPDTDG